MRFQLKMLTGLVLTFVVSGCGVTSADLILSATLSPRPSHVLVHDKPPVYVDSYTVVEPGWVETEYVEEVEYWEPAPSPVYYEEVEYWEECPDEYYW